jgi:hypothetical protein
MTILTINCIPAILKAHGAGRAPLPLRYNPDQTEGSTMSSHPGQNSTPPATAGEAGWAERRHKAVRDRRAFRTDYLTDVETAAIEASEMAPGFEHLNAEVDDA